MDQKTNLKNLIIPMPNLLFVCTANICRSPMAAGLFDAMLTSRGLKPAWQIQSAGTWGENDFAAAQGTIQVLDQRGIDYRRHRSRIVTRAIIDTADLILTMERGHKEALQVEFPDKKEQIFLLSEMTGKKFDVADPIASPLEAFEATALELEEILEHGFRRIIELGESFANRKPTQP